MVVVLSVPSQNNIKYSTVKSPLQRPALSFTRRVVWVAELVLGRYF